jgi:1,4-alpha-glucan branching enzyme
MPKKTLAKDGAKAKVTFEIKVAAESVNLAGDFNDWDQSGTALAKRKDGRFSTTLTLPTGQEYRYRYLLDGEVWENDADADRYEPNGHGSDDCVIDLT